MNTILITGGCGFIGSNLTKKLYNTTSNRLIVLDKLTYANNYKDCLIVEGPTYSFIKGDILDTVLLETIFEKENIDIILHLAAESHVDNSINSSKIFMETNIIGTYTLLETARKYWKNKEGKKFIHISTDEVYGSLGPMGYFTEETPYCPNSPYSASKASSDHLVRAWNKTYGLPTIITNCSNNYGPGQHVEKLIPQTIVNALKGKDIPVYGDGQNIRDWIHVEDHCRAIISLIDRGKIGETYNIGSHNEQTNIDIVKKICIIIDEILNTDNILKQRYSFNGTSRLELIKFVTDRPGHDRRYAIDSSKYEKEVNNNTYKNFDMGLKETILYYINKEKEDGRI